MLHYVKKNTETSVMPPKAYGLTYKTWASVFRKNGSSTIGEREETTRDVGRSRFLEHGWEKS